MIYEYRTCKVRHGFEKMFIETRVVPWLPIAEKYGAKIVGGIYQPEIGDEETHISYIMGFDSLAHREKVFASLRKDPDFLGLLKYWKIDKEAQGQYYGWTMPGFHNTILKSTEYASTKHELPKFDAKGYLVT